MSFEKVKIEGNIVRRGGGILTSGTVVNHVSAGNDLKTVRYEYRSGRHCLIDINDGSATILICGDMVDVTLRAKKPFSFF